MINNIKLSLKLRNLKTKSFFMVVLMIFLFMLFLIQPLIMFKYVCFFFFICCCAHEFNPSSHVSIPILIIFVFWNLYLYSHLLSTKPCYGRFISPLQSFGFFHFMFLGMCYLGFLF